MPFAPKPSAHNANADTHVPLANDKRQSPFRPKANMTTSFFHSHAHAHPHPHRSYTSPSAPLFHPQPQRAQPTQSQLINPPPLTHSTSYASSPSSSSFPHTPKTLTGRPKPSKKVSTSTASKHKNVQDRLEVKVERAKGFHAFFVPLARTLPPAPPSSPVLGQRAPPATAANAGGEDYFEGWDKHKVGRREQWVEDVSGEEDSGMEVDSE